ncbi:MAG TPA: hypothetical protein PLI30_05775, partial [Petrimonas sp.]|nr:hypothetical protein [Petrimonas sp.]
PYRQTVLLVREIHMLFSYGCYRLIFFIKVVMTIERSGRLVDSHPVVEGGVQADLRASVIRISLKFSV